MHSRIAHGLQGNKKAPAIALPPTNVEGHPATIGPARAARHVAAAAPRTGIPSHFASLSATSAPRAEKNPPTNGDTSSGRHGMK
jgi:hypothetical protein